MRTGAVLVLLLVVVATGFAQEDAFFPMGGTHTAVWWGKDLLPDAHEMGANWVEIVCGAAGGVPDTVFRFSA